jgi:hypothetical protein
VVTAGIGLQGTLSERPSGHVVLGWTKWAIAIAVAGLAMSGAAPAIAGDTTVQVQRLGPPDVETRRKSLLKQMLARPNDLDLAFEYATLSSQVGDYEAAASTLERMLIYAPNTPRLQLELGILYYKLGSFEVARAYFAQALANPSVPPSPISPCTATSWARAMVRPAPITSALAILKRRPISRPISTTCTMPRSKLPAARPSIITAATLTTTQTPPPTWRAENSLA